VHPIGTDFLIVIVEVHAAHLLPAQKGRPLSLTRYDAGHVVHRRLAHGLFDRYQRERRRALDTAAHGGALSPTCQADAAVLGGGGLMTGRAQGDGAFAAFHELVFAHGGDFDHAAVFHALVELAAHPALGAGRAHRGQVFVAAQETGLLPVEGAHGADPHILSARDTV